MPLVADSPQTYVPRRTTRRSDGKFVVVAIVLLVATSVWLRVWQLSNLPGINGDEAWSGVQAMRIVRGEPVAWTTPTGNPVNVFFMGPLVLLHLIGGPSVAVLRAVAVLSGLTACGLNYWLCWRVYDRRTALVSTLMVAVLPINIAYSRFAWDASQTLLLVLPAMYLSLGWLRRVGDSASLPVGAMVALAAAMWVHPTNVFAVPLVAGPIFYARRVQLLDAVRSTAMQAQPRALVGLMVISAAVVYSAWTLLVRLGPSLHGPGDLPALMANYLKLLSGETVYEFISCVQHAADGLWWYRWLPLASTILVAAVSLCAAWGWGRRLSERRDAVDIAFLWSWLAMVVGFALVAGPEALEPHRERYGICLVAPAVLALARGLSWWIEPERRWRGAAQWCALSSGGVLLLIFYLGYFEFIHRTGSLSHRAFRTASVEPKWAVFEHIATDRSGDVPDIEIRASEWWLYWPLEYFALGRKDVVVGGLREAVDPQARPAPPSGAEQWIVEFAGSPAELDFLRSMPRGSLRQVWVDFGARPAISAIKLPRDAELE